MKELKIFCKNTQQYIECEKGVKLSSLLGKIKLTLEGDPLVALVDNQLKSLDYQIYNPHDVEFIDIFHMDGRRTYIRTLSFVLQKAVKELYPHHKLSLDYSLPSGLYGEIREIEENSNSIFAPKLLSEMDLNLIKKRMEKIIASDIPFEVKKISNREAQEIFINNNQPEKAKIVETSHKNYVSVYYLDGYPDTFYGPLMPSTGYIKVWDLKSYYNGFCLQATDMNNPTKTPMMIAQQKISDVFKENSDWCQIMDVDGLGTLNNVVREGNIVSLIQIVEALHEKKYAEIAKEIYARRDRVKVILISGPSSSGKTTTSKRISLHTKVLGLNPRVIELDNYFVSREKTPKDENGEYDFESLYALDLDLFNEQINQLLEGQSVELPRFDFVKGDRVYEGNVISLGEKDILIIEGIHALNPLLTDRIPEESKFKIYVSALTSLSLDENNNISTSDNRMMRRMVRDNQFRGIKPENTINMWPSVRRGEVKNIFPFQENADIVFNSSLLYELPLLKYYAEPLLRRIPITSEAYPDAIRILKFLSLVEAMSPQEIAAIPPTSIIKEFIGGSSFTY